MATVTSGTPSRRMSFRQPGVLSITLLVTTLVLTALLAYQGVDAARSHRRTVENTLRDYASIAALEFSRRARDMLGYAVDEALAISHKLDPLPQDGAPPGPAILIHGLEASGVRARTVFRVDLEDGAVEAIALDSTPVDAAWLGDSITGHDASEDYRRNNTRLFTLTDQKGREQAVAYHLVGDGSGRPVVAYGFITSASEFVAPRLTACSRDALLPEALAEGRPTDSLLSLRVLGRHGEQIFWSPIAYDTMYAATDTLGARFGDLRIQAAIRPEAAGMLVIGGLPGSRLPLLFALLLLTVGVGVALLLQMRRERQLALLRDDFVSSVSHELRTPLAQIRMFGELLDQGRLRNSEEVQRSTSVINREARRLSHLVENILLFSRLQRTSTDLTRETTDLSAFIGDVVEAFTPLARARGVTLRQRIESEVTVPVNRDALSQILLNLFDNAVKYGPAGQDVTVAVACEGGEARIAVEDRGPGVPEASRREIWSPYRRLPRDANTTVVGSGIGLSVVAELAELHGGRAWVEDAPGGGARFVVAIPGARAASPAGSRTAGSVVP